MISEWKCRYLDNLGPVLAYRWDRRVLVGEAARVLAELDRNGVAITSVSALLRDPSSFSALETAVAELERSSAAQIAETRRAAGRSGGWKTYLLEFLGKHPVLDPQSPCARFALQPEVLSIANPTSACVSGCGPITSGATSRRK